MAFINLREPVYLKIQNLASRPLLLFGRNIVGGVVQMVPVTLEDPDDPSWDALVFAMRAGTARVSYPGVGKLAELIVKAALANPQEGAADGLLYVALNNSYVINTVTETTFDTGQYSPEPTIWSVGNVVRVSASGKVAALADSSPTVRLRFRYGFASAIPGQAGVVANIIAGAAAGSLRLSGLTGMTVASVGRQIALSGTGSGHDGTFVIVAYVSATSVDVQGTGTVPDVNNGAIEWVEQQNNILCDSTPMTLLPNAPGSGGLSAWTLQADLVCRVAGTNGVLMTTGQVSMPGAGVAGAILQHGIVSLNLNTKRLLYVTAEWDTANAANVATLEGLTVELLSRPVSI